VHPFPFLFDENEREVVDAHRVYEYRFESFFSEYELLFLTLFHAFSV
jgi:hypothetical protein